MRRGLIEGGFESTAVKSGAINQLQVLLSKLLFVLQTRGLGYRCILTRHSSKSRTCWFPPVWCSLFASCWQLHDSTVSVSLASVGSHLSKAVIAASCRLLQTFWAVSLVAANNFKESLLLILHADFLPWLATLCSCKYTCWTVPPAPMCPRAYVGPLYLFTHRMLILVGHVMYGSLQHNQIL